MKKILTQITKKFTRNTHSLLWHTGLSRARTGVQFKPFENKSKLVSRYLADEINLMVEITAGAFDSKIVSKVFEPVQFSTPGYKVLRFHEDEIRENVYAVLAHIEYEVYRLKQKNEKRILIRPLGV